MPHYHAVVWIDHTEAKVYTFSPTAADGQKLRPHDRHVHVHRKAGLGDSGKAKPDQHYFHSVAEAIAAAGEILLVGPGTARSELLKHLKAHDPEVAKKIVGVEPMDHPTDGELLKYARRYLKAADRMR